MAQRPAVNRARSVVQIADEMFRSDDSQVTRTRVSASGRARDYSMVSNAVVYDVERWLSAEEALVRRVHSALDEYVVKGRMVLKAWFVKTNPATAEVLRRELVYLSSLAASYIHNFQQWYSEHIIGIIKNLETFNRNDSGLEYDCIEGLDIKFNLLPKLSGRAHFSLPNKLKQMRAVVNIDVKEAYFKYALLSIMHYKDIAFNRQRASKYEQWLDDLDFGDVDPPMSASKVMYLR